VSAIVAGVTPTIGFAVWSSSLTCVVGAAEIGGLVALGLDPFVV
jgi:hypothetical protein